jgi:putative ABC transport system permease protein
MPLAIQPAFLLASLLLSGVIGIAAGLAPAHKAAQLHPVDALRSE